MDSGLTMLRVFSRLTRVTQTPHWSGGNKTRDAETVTPTSEVFRKPFTFELVLRT